MSAKDSPSPGAPSWLDLDVELHFAGFHLAFTGNLPLAGITGLFGPSGCGKSTLLRIIAGLEGNAQGRVAFAGEVWHDSAANRFVPPHRRGVGYVFQDTRLFAHLTVRGNLAYAERRSRRADGPIDPAPVINKTPAIDMPSVIEAFDLAPLLDRRTQALSGGERQRVAIARTLLSRPRLLLMDEPLAALDHRRKGEILPYIERLPKSFGVPTIYVTHAIDEATRLADRLVLMASGKRTASGPTRELLERLDLQPATGRFEAGTLITARVVDHDQAFQLTRLDLEGQPLLMPALDLAIGSTVQLRVRARDVALATTRPEGISIRNILEGRITDLVLEPDTAFAEILVAIGSARLRARITRAAVTDLTLRPGSPVFALIKSISFDRRALASTAE